jgi:hypothetical protein
MVPLILVCGLGLTAAMIVESRLSLNTLVERAVMIFSLAAGQLILSVQFLSLVTCLDRRGLILAAIVSLALACCLARIRRVPANRLPWKRLLEDARINLASGNDMHFVVTLFVAAAMVLGLNAVAGIFMIPLGDPYHFEMPLFWRQNHSIEPFVTHDPRITCSAFAGEVLGLPGYMFCKTGTLWLGVVWLAGILSLGIVYSLAGRLGCRPRASMVAAILLLAIPTWYRDFIGSDAAMCLAGLWGGASTLFLMRCRDTVKLSGEFLTRLGCSVFCFVLACGAKNTTIFLAPIYLLGLAIYLRRLLFEVKVMQALAGWGIAALLCSGVLWNYGFNFKWYGSIGGPRFTNGTLSSDRGIRPVWTRCCRGAVLFLFDVTWLPQSADEIYQTVCQKAVRLLGGKSELSEDDQSLYNFQDIRPGAGIGLIGPLIVLPAFIYAIIRFLRRGKNPQEDKLPGAMDFLLLLLLVTGYSLLCHVFLKWQDVGVWRLMPAFPLLAAPVCGLLLGKPWQRIAALTLAGLCMLVQTSESLAMMANRFAANQRGPGWEDSRFFNNFFSKIGKHHPSEVVECQWGNEAPQKTTIYEPYNSREIALMFLQKAKHPAVIGFAGSVISDAYYFFGPDLSNRIVPLVDASQPYQLLEPPPNADYLVFAQNARIEPAAQNLWAMRHGYTPFLQVNENGQCMFLSFEKNPSPEPGN